MTAIDLETRAAIADLNARFAWALDRREYDALRGVLAPNVHYVGSGGEFADVESVIAAFQDRPAGRTTRHGLGNVVLEQRNDRTVAGMSSWHTFASEDEPPVGIALSLVADFYDVYTFGDDVGWLISERLIRPVFREPRLAPAKAGSRA